MTPPGGDMTAASGPRYGMVRLASSTYMVGPQTFTRDLVNAVFIDTNVGGAARCARTQQGSCFAYQCPTPGMSIPHAGDISITTGKQPVMMRPRSDGVYPGFVAVDMALFGAGQSYNVNASGSSVAAFQSSAMFDAGQFTLTSPSGSGVLDVNVPTTQDFSAAWTPLTGSKVRIELSQDTDQVNGIYITCEFEGSAGSGTVPASLLAKLQPTSGNNHIGSIFIGPSTTRSVTAGSNWQVDVIALGVGRAGSARIMNQ